MKRAKNIEEFLSFFPEDRQALETIREVMLSTGMEEGVKWGAPIYMVDGKNVAGLGAFKSYIGVWFHNGAFLKDEKKVLINAQMDVTKGLRQWRFKRGESIPTDLLKAYALEAIENEKAGKRIKPTKQKLVIPEELENALKDDMLRAKFEAFTPFKQKEFAQHIGDAKREATRKSRLEKCIPLILEGVGLNDKYR